MTAVDCKKNILVRVKAQSLVRNAMQCTMKFLKSKSVGTMVDGATGYRVDGAKYQSGGY